MTEPTREQLNKALARWEGWKYARGRWWASARASHLLGPFASQYTTCPNLLAETAEANDVAWRLLTYLGEHYSLKAASYNPKLKEWYLGVFDSKKIKWLNVRGITLREAVARAAWAAGIIGGQDD